MRNEELYRKTIGILTDAYFADELISQDCTACACGNLIAANLGYIRVDFENKSVWVDKDGNYIEPEWINVFGTPRGGFLKPVKQWVKLNNLNPESKREIDSTGYKLHELALIERSFEKGYKGWDKMFNGMMAVVDALDEIHGNYDKNVTNLSKRMFVKSTR